MVKGTDMVHAMGALLIGMGWDRLALALAIVVALVVLVIAGEASFSEVLPIFTLLVGYVVGAGHEAAKPAPKPEE